MGKIIGIETTCSKLRRKKWLKKYQCNVSFIFFNLHSIFWFWSRLLFHFELVFLWNPWDFSENDHWTEICGLIFIKNNFELFVGSFFKGLGLCGR
jgi:hypothetical protein